MSQQSFGGTVRVLSTPDESRLLQVALMIGTELSASAVWVGDECSWFITGQLNGAPLHRPIGSSLYSGSAGIALFLTELAAEVDAPSLMRLAEGALAHALRDARGYAPSADGFHWGRTGVAFAAARHAELHGRSTFLTDALVPLRARLFSDAAAAVDVFSGVAGAIAPLLHVARQCEDGRLQSDAIALGGTLLQRAQRSALGSSWPSGERWPVNLTGFAHGASGCAHALLELHDLTASSQFRSCAEEAMRYELAFFDADEGNWLDLSGSEVQRAAHRVLVERDSAFVSVAHALSPAQRRFSTLWCHGAPGIGLARLRSCGLGGNEAMREELHAAIDNTIRAMPHLVTQGKFSLCHGVAGNLELLTLAAEQGGTGERQDVIQASIEAGIGDLCSGAVETITGRQTGVIDPGLMSGFTGIGYAALRMLRRSTLSVLCPSASGTS